ncbi:MAG: ketopantoate reductase family protein [Candidatus Ornithomonoglobus sp.]
MKIQTVAIIGAGAIGGYFIWGLYEKLGGGLWVIAENERAERLKKNGIKINGRNYNLNVKTPEEARGADLLLVCTKYSGLEDACLYAKKIVTENTIVMSLMNGVDSEERLADAVGAEHIVYSMMRISSEHKNDEIIFDGAAAPGLFYGEAGQSIPSERMDCIRELLEDTPVNHHQCEDIVREIWDKFALNVSNNLPQAIINCGIGAYDDSEYAMNIYMGLKKEVVAIAAAKGIVISSEPDNSCKKGIVTKDARYSTLQDIDAKRHTEVDMFAGTVVKLGKKLGIPTPYNEFAYNAIKAIEERNDGKFDYSDIQ